MLSLGDVEEVIDNRHDVVELEATLGLPLPVIIEEFFGMTFEEIRAHPNITAAGLRGFDGTLLATGIRQLAAAVGITPAADPSNPNKLWTRQVEFTVVTASEGQSQVKAALPIAYPTGEQPKKKGRKGRLGEIDRRLEAVQAAARSGRTKRTHGKGPRAQPALPAHVPYRPLAPSISTGGAPGAPQFGFAPSLTAASQTAAKLGTAPARPAISAQPPRPGVVAEYGLQAAGLTGPGLAPSPTSTPAPWPGLSALRPPPPFGPPSPPSVPPRAPSSPPAPRRPRRRVGAAGARHPKHLRGLAALLGLGV
eukprot:tig00020510_g9885.t1